MAPAQPQAPTPLSADAAIALSRRIIAEGRAPTKAENDAIHVALNVGQGGSGGPIGSAALQAYSVHVDIMERQATAEARRATEAARIADIRATWAGRPARWRALPAESRTLFLLARFSAFQQGVPVDESLRRSLVAAARELARPLDEIEIPQSFEEPLVVLVQAEGVSRTGEQKWTDNS